MAWLGRGSGAFGLFSRREIRTDPIFIFASGNRCGSTLLQRLLNSNPQILIWGEHGGALQDVLEGSDRLREWCYDKRDEGEAFFRRGPDQFIPNFSPPAEVVEAAAKNYMLEVFGRSALAAGRQIWGFKEVRYGVPTAILLQELFPEARFIHLTRRIDHCFISMKRWELGGEWKRSWTLEALENWTKINASFLGGESELTNLLSIRYEDMTMSNPSEFVSRLATFLDLPEKALDRQVFDRRLSGSTYAGDVTLTEEEQSLISSDEISSLNRKLKYV